MGIDWSTNVPKKKKINLFTPKNTIRALFSHKLGVKIPVKKHQAISYPSLQRTKAHSSPPENKAELCSFFIPGSFCPFVPQKVSFYSTRHSARENDQPCYFRLSYIMAGLSCLEASTKKKIYERKCQKVSGSLSEFSRVNDQKSEFSVFDSGEARTN